MATKILAKRSSVASKVPLTTDLTLGELALNTYDGAMYFKKSPGGTDSIVTVATLDGTQTFTNKTLTSPTISNGTINGTVIGGTTPAAITGTTVTATGDLVSSASAGDEGGQILLSKSVTNTTLTTGITIDVYQNRLRFFETGGTSRGYYIDISGGDASAGTNLVGSTGSGSGTVTSVSGTGSVSGLTLTGSGTTSVTLTLGGSLDLSSPPAIGDTTPAAGTFTTISSSTAPTNTVPALSLTGTPNNAAGAKTGVLAVGPNFTATDKNIMASFVQNINDYTQIVVQNPNSGASASSDFIVNNDNTTGAGTYGDFGINSSAFSGTGSLGLANATYLYSQGGDLAIGTAGDNNIHFVINSGATDALTLTSTGLGVGVSSPTAALHLEAGLSSTSGAPLKFSTGNKLTTPEVGAVEYDGTAFYTTENTTSGRGRIDTFYQYRMTTAGTATATTITDYFPANSTLSLEASSIYEMDVVAVFIKNTAGTLTWSWATTSAPSFMRSYYVGTSTAGFTTTAGTGAAITGMAAVQGSGTGASTLAHAVTGSITNNSYHYYNFKVFVVTNAACNIRLRITNSAGSITAQAGSYYTVRKMSANTGVFVA